MAWFKRKNKKIKISEKKAIPDGLWEKCPNCNEIIYKPEIEKRLSICHHCNYHFRISHNKYVDILLDDGTSKMYFENLTSKDFLGFAASKTYEDQLVDAKSKTGTNDAILSRPSVCTAGICTVADIRSWSRRPRQCCQTCGSRCS